MRENVFLFMETSTKKKKQLNDLERFKEFYKNPNMEDYNYFKKIIKINMKSKGELNNV